MREILLPENETAQTLETFLSRNFPIGYVRKVLRKNGARINGRRAKGSDLLKGRDRVQLFIAFEERTRPLKESKVTVPTIFEDESLLVVDKPAGIAVHEGKTVSKGSSLLGILESRYRGMLVKPRLIHRLDKDTSGLLLVAKNHHTAERMIAVFESGAVVKEYLCLLVGRIHVEKDIIDLPLPGREGHAVRALTRYRVSKRYAETTLARAAIETGRLHQIRLHFAKLGFPVVLDEQHGDFGFNRRFRKQFGLKRQFLHAEKLKIPYGGKTREWNAPLPEDLRQVLRKLDEQAG